MRTIIAYNETFYDYGVNKADLIYKNFQIWRLITAPFFFDDYTIPLLVFILVVFSKRERTMGTVKYFIYFWWMSTVSQIIIVILGFLQSLVGYKYTVAQSYGMLSYIVAECTFKSIKDPCKHVLIL